MVLSLPPLNQSMTATARDLPAFSSYGISLFPIHHATLPFNTMNLSAHIPTASSSYMNTNTL
jgi:hypothetical protein